MKQKACGPDQRNAFQNRYLAAIIAVMALFTSADLSAQSDSAKYSRINGYGFVYKRMAHDSVLAVPLYESPFNAWRPGSLTYRKADSTLYVWTGYQRIPVGAHGAGGGIDTLYMVNDSTMGIEKADLLYFMVIRGQPRTQVLNDSTFIIGKDTLMVRGTGGGGTDPSKVPLTRTITINGNSQDLSANRTWTLTKADIGLGNVDNTSDLNKPVSTAQQAALDQKTNNSDTASILGPYVRGSGTTDQLAIWDGTRSITGDPGITANRITNTIISDSIRAKTIEANEHLLAPLKDTLAALARRGELRFDSTKNTMWYRANGQWAALSSLTNSLIPNRPNMRILAGVIRATLDGDTIRWGAIVDVKHDSIFYTAVHGTTQGRICVHYPHASKVITFIAVPDETYSQLGVSFGSSVEVDSASIFVYVNGGTQSGFIRGTGGTWVKSTNINSWVLKDSVNRTWLTYGSSVNNFWGDYNGLIAQYTGTNGNYQINKIVGSPVGSGSIWGASIQLTDEYGNPVTTIDAADVITFKSNYSARYTVNTLVNTANGFPAAVLTTGLSNIWIFGVFEL